MKGWAGFVGMGILLVAACAEAPGPIGLRIFTTPESIDVRIDGYPILYYAIATLLPFDTIPAYYARSGFLEARSPAGRLITDDFPAGHTHQHGIFTAWTSATFRGEHVDFWNQHHETGTVRHRDVLEVKDSGEVVGFRVRLEQVSLQYGPILEEDWRVRVYGDRDPYIWDLRSEQRNVTADTLFLDRYDYGGLGVRGSAEWNRVDSLRYGSDAQFLTSDGLTRDSANHRRPEWVAMYGPLDDKDGGGTSGIAVFPHPENFRAPQFVRVHPEMPYLSVTPVVEEGFFIPPGGTYLARYRFVVFDGAPQPEQLAGLGWRARPAR